jgi:hypothetical protein
MALMAAAMLAPWPAAVRAVGNRTDFDAVDGEGACAAIAPGACGI